MGGINAQRVQTIAPKKPVVMGTAFQVQYVIVDPSDLLSTTPPAFDSFQIVSGPNHYKGTTLIDGKQQPIENITYTLIPSKTGTLVIKGITASFKNGIEQRSEDVPLSVDAPPKASFSVRSSYTDASLYAPKSKADIEKLIRENLFLKVEVSKKECFLGEPVVATFKLYSRLQSSSEAVKSPSFYGFSVRDMVKINEAHASVETINGKVFNTSVLRQVQLYPDQAGKLTIDEMYLQNTIEFDDSVTNRKDVINKELVSQPVVINVKPLPAKKPEYYTGAVGDFSISAHLLQNRIGADQQGKLLVTISGKGNFIQFGLPTIQWPSQFEAFDPSITDHLNKTSAPETGERTYEFGFTTDSSSRYIIPPVRFSFFNPGTAAFRTLTTDSLKLEVIKGKVLPEPVKDKVSQPVSYLWLLILLPLSGIIVFAIRKINKKNKPEEKDPPPASHIDYGQLITRLDVSNMTDKQTCFELQKIISDFHKEYEMHLTEAQREELASIRRDCQEMVYSNIDIEGKKEELKARAMKVLEYRTRNTE
jgi:hypothetical protein